MGLHGVVFSGMALSGRAWFCVVDYGAVCLGLFRQGQGGWYNSQTPLIKVKKTLKEIGKGLLWFIELLYNRFYIKQRR